MLRSEQSEPRRVYCHQNTDVGDLSAYDKGLLNPSWLIGSSFKNFKCLLGVYNKHIQIKKIKILILIKIAREL